MKCAVWLVLLAIFPALSHLTACCDPPMSSLLLWPQVTRARGRKGEKTQSKNAAPRPSEEQSLCFPALALRQTVPELHSRRNRGPLEPTLLSPSPPPPLLYSLCLHSRRFPSDTLADPLPLSFSLASLVEKSRSGLAAKDTSTAPSAIEIQTCDRAARRCFKLSGKICIRLLEAPTFSSAACRCWSPKLNKHQ